MTRTAPLLALCALAACGSSPSARPLSAAAEPPGSSPGPESCESWGVPVELRFPCLDATFLPDFARNAEVFEALVRTIPRRPGLRRVIVHGTVSVNGTPERDHLELAAQRARSVAEALIAAGVPPAMIEVDEELRDDALAANEPDPCPARAEDAHGDRRRRVAIDLVLCER